MRFFYTLISALVLPAIVARLWWRGRHLPGYRRRWHERFGFVSVGRDERPLVWVHAVSVGEAIAAAPVVRFLLARGDVQVLVTTMTPTGSERVVDLFGDQVLHSYIPYDLPWLLHRFISRTRPSLALILETELWPNVLRACRKRHIPALLLNARLSAKSANGYGLFPSFMQGILGDLNHAAVQNAEDAERFLELGLPREKCTVTGSIKFDLTLSEDLIKQAAALKEDWTQNGRRLVWIAASTHEGEEEQVLEAFSQVKREHPDCLLLLVPRHPDRFEQVGRLCEASGFKWLQRSKGQTPSGEVDIMLGDTMGEMLLLYGVADIAFVGGSLVAKGGHNLVEPAAWCLPLISGPHLFNFAEVAKLMLAGKALKLVRDGETLAEAANQLLLNADARHQQGIAAKRVADANRGALRKVEKLISDYLPATKQVADGEDVA